MASEGVMKAAIMMLALGEDEAAEVMRYLSPKDVQKLGAAMASMKSVARETVESTMASFLLEADQSKKMTIDSEEYIRSVLIKALGNDKAASLINRITQTKDAGVESLQWIDARTVAGMVRDEHPQIIATILVHLEPDHASEVLGYLDPELSEDLIIRVATLDDVKPVAMRELNEVMSKLLSTKTDSTRGGSIGGIKAAADIINYMKTEIEASTIASVRAFDEGIAQKIIDEMFIFDGLLDIDDRGIQALLRDVPSEMLVTALKGTTVELQEKIFKNMSSRAAETLREDFETKGPVKLSEVVDQQKEILQIVRRLAEEGTIMLRGKGGDDQYV